MSVNLSSFKGAGSTRIRREFWKDVRDAVIAAQKLAGHNISVSEFPGKGTIINAARKRTASTGACCAEDGTCTITTSAACTGTYQGNGTVCDPNPCPSLTTGACCVDGVCSILSAADCASGGGIYLGDGVSCGPHNPCCSDCSGAAFQIFVPGSPPHCYSTQNCDGTFSDEVDCAITFLNSRSSCCPVGGCDCGPCTDSTGVVDPVDCGETDVLGDCGSCLNQSLTLTNPVVPCPGGFSPPP